MNGAFTRTLHRMEAVVVPPKAKARYARSVRVRIGDTFKAGKGFHTSAQDESSRLTRDEAPQPVPSATIPLKFPDGVPGGQSLHLRPSKLSSPFPRGPKASVHSHAHMHTAHGPPPEATAPSAPRAVPQF